MATEDDEIDEETYEKVIAVMREIERARDEGKLDRSKWRRERDKAKKIAGKFWGEVAEAFENLKP